MKLVDVTRRYDEPNISITEDGEVGCTGGRHVEQLDDKILRSECEDVETNKWFIHKW